jgi:hypothetical protein
MDNGYPNPYGRNVRQNQTNSGNHHHNNPAAQQQQQQLQQPGNLGPPQGAPYDAEMRQRFSQMTAGAPMTPGGGLGPMDAMGMNAGGYRTDGNLMGGGQQPQGGFGFQDVSPGMQQQRMSTGQGMYVSQGGGGPGNSPNYPNTGVGGMGGGEQMTATSEPRTGGNSQGMPNASSAAGGAPSGSQAEREEELLLNLLIARRQRSRTPGEPGAAQREGFYADELLRLRQGRAAHQNMPHVQSAAAARGEGSLPPMPGMPPIYMDPVNTLPAVSGHPMNLGMNNYERFGSDVAMNLPTATIQEGEQRIDRSPPHLMDARSQDMMMRDFSGRGIKRGPYDLPPQHAMKYHMQMQGIEMAPATRKKRSHKKKPADMPRRPLSAYNLFFSEERERILKEIDGKTEEGKKEEDKTGDGEAKEGTTTEAKEGETPAESEEASKPKALLRPLIPNMKKRRPHRKTHGKISFQQLARMVGERWKALPMDDRKYYQDLAQEDMKRQKQAMEEYYTKQQAIKDGITLPPPMDASKQPMETAVPGGTTENSVTL